MCLCLCLCVYVFVYVYFYYDRCIKPLNQSSPCLAHGNTISQSRIVALTFHPQVKVLQRAMQCFHLYVQHSLYPRRGTLHYEFQHIFYREREGESVREREKERESERKKERGHQLCERLCALFWMPYSIDLQLKYLQGGKIHLPL